MEVEWSVIKSRIAKDETSKFRLARNNKATKQHSLSYTPRLLEKESCYQFPR